MGRSNGKRKIIEAEVERRIAAGESLAVRAITGAVGGSATTVLEVLKALNKPKPLEAISGELVDAELSSGAMLPNVRSELAIDPVLLQEMVETALKNAMEGQLSTLQKDVKNTVAYSMDKAEYGYQRMMEIADAMKLLFNDIASGKAPLTPPKLPRPSVASPAASAALQLQQLQSQIMRLDKQKMFLLRVISNSGIEVDLDSLDDIR